jgi:hypothetical protein
LQCNRNLILDLLWSNRVFFDTRTGFGVQCPESVPVFSCSLLLVISVILE